MNRICVNKLQVGQQKIDILLPARILSVVEQNNDILLYSIIDDDKSVPTISVDVLVIGTNDIVEYNIGLYTFLGTVKCGDKEIWHVFYMYIYDDHIGVTGVTGVTGIAEVTRTIETKKSEIRSYCRGGRLCA